MPNPQYPEMLELIRSAVAGVLVDKGIEIGAAREAGHVAAERIRKELGGFAHYVPAGKQYELSLRDQQIYAEWKPGENELELCRKFAITERHLRRVIEAKRAEDRATRQGSLSM